MDAIALLLAILLTNRVATQTSKIFNSVNTVNTLLTNSTESIFALQIQGIRTTTTEATPAAFAGNNLNDFDGTVTPPYRYLGENFQAITSYHEKAADKKHKVKGEGNVKLPSLGRKFSINKNLRSELTIEDKTSLIIPSAMVWDNCLETNNRDIPLKTLKANDLDNTSNDYQIQQSNIEIGNIWSKRSAGSLNYSLAIKAWLDKYDSMKEDSRTERSLQKTDSIFLKKIRQSPTTTTEKINTVQIIPMLKEVLKKPFEIINVTQNNIATESNVILSYTEDWFELKDWSKIRFSGLPQKETYLIPALKLEEGFHPFAFMSDFFTLIYPFNFPVGLIKDIVWGKFTFPYSFIQSIKVESTFLAFIIAFACIALVIPSYLLILGLLSLCPRSSSDDEMETGALFPEEKDSDCNDRALVIVTLFVVLLCCVLISGMAVSNEQARMAADQSQSVVSYACADIASWLSAAARDLHHSIIPPVDLVSYAFNEDLKNIEALLGEPIEKAIVSESGIDLVFDSLIDIIQESEEISSKISSLRDVSVKAGAMAAAASDRIKDLARQLDNLKKICIAKDAPLCDTINTNSLTVQLKFELILHEQQLLQLRSLGVINLTQAIATVRNEFKALPSAIANQTVDVRNDIVKDIEIHRKGIYKSSKILNDIVRHLTSGLYFVARKFEEGLHRLQKYDFWRWTTMLVMTFEMWFLTMGLIRNLEIAQRAMEKSILEVPLRDRFTNKYILHIIETTASLVTFAFVMTLIVFGMMCGCSDAKNHGKRTLQVSAVWLCFASLILWALISATFLITGHAEVYVCHALWDTPQYETITALLDKPSPLLSNNEGIFDALFRDLDNVTMDVSVKDVLRDCEKDQPAYLVFQLDKILDVNKETSYFEWDELQSDLERLASSVNVRLLKTTSFNFSRLLNMMLSVSDVNLAKYRMEYNGPMVGKDLPSLVDQLENIAAQVSDLTTAGRLETLATRTQRLYLTNIKPLEQLRADVVFKLTELELQLMPFRRKLNISLSHIHTAQYYIDNQGEIIAQMDNVVLGEEKNMIPEKVSAYVSRLISHAADWRTHVLVSVGTQAARCRPLFSVYSAARTLLCSKYVASLHGWWVCGLFLGIIWCTTLTPLCVKLWRTYGRKIRAHESLILTNLGSGQQETPTTALCDGSNWNTPGPPPPRSDSW